MEKEFKELMIAIARHQLYPNNGYAKATLYEKMYEAIINSPREETKSVSDNEAKKEVCDHIYSDPPWFKEHRCTKCGHKQAN